jgi:hypothetical protein
MNKNKKVILFGAILAIIFLPRINIFVMNIIPNFIQLFTMVKYYTYPYVATHDISHMQFINRDEIFYIQGLSNYMDLSTFSRLFTYISLYNSINSFSLIVGNGPGFYGKAVDSSTLRIFGEVGILGFIFFYMTLKKLSFIFNKKTLLFSFIVFISLSDIFFTVRFICFLFLVQNLFKYGFFKR